MIGADTLRIARAENDMLIAEDGRRYIDLFSAHGATWLGHGRREIAARIAAQLQLVWITGGLHTAVALEAKAMVESFFPPSHALAGLCSTGMEAAEFALRIARVVTKRNGVVGFEHNMHGKSLATAFLGWDNHDDLQLPGFHRLAFPPSCSEDETLSRLAECLRRDPVSAVFVEPIQGLGGGHTASPDWYGEVNRLCRQHDVLLVFDEILTGFYRTGPPFCFSELGFVPDVVLIGKAMGNGFPVSGVVVDARHAIVKAMLPGSTYAGNPLAAAAVLATLRQITSVDLPARVARIEQTIVAGLARLPDLGVTLRGKGAMWILELPPGTDVDQAAMNIYRAGVCVGFAGRYLRLLPAATIEPDNLARGCAVISEQLERMHHGRARRP